MEKVDKLALKAGKLKQLGKSEKSEGEYLWRIYFLSLAICLPPSPNDSSPCLGFSLSSALELDAFVTAWTFVHTHTHSLKRTEGILVFENFAHFQSLFQPNISYRQKV